MGVPVEMGSGNVLAHRITRGENGAVSPLSFPQERMFLLDRIMPGLPVYNVPTLVRVRATLDAELLRQACERVVERHEILRTTVKLADGTPVQEVRASQPFQLTVVDLRTRTPTQREQEAAALFAELGQRPFDLSRDVLLRAALVHYSDDEDRLLIVFHHIASDHASSTILFRELDELYRALQDNRPPVLSQLPIQYSDFASWQREHLSGRQLDELTDYWSARLAGAPERLDLPAARPRPSVQSYRGNLREFTISDDLASPLREVARRHGVSMFMLLMAGFKALLHRYTGIEDLVVGAPASGRLYEETTNLLGFFSNTLVLRTDVSGDPTFAGLLARVKETTLEAQVYQELSFEKLVEALNPERAQSHSPIVQVLLGYDVAPTQAPQLGGQPLELLPVPGWEWSRLDLSIILRETSGGSLHAHLEYATDLFDASTVERLIGHYITLLRGAAADPGLRVSELPILTAEERHRTLVEWNDTIQRYDSRCVHELVSEQVARTPDAVAVVSGSDRLSYAQLQTRANQLAHELIDAGVQPGSLVGICLERSAEVIVSMLAVLQTGAAYVPIDPTFPPQRQEFMLTDSEAAVLVTERRLADAIRAPDVHVVCVDADGPQSACGAAPVEGLYDTDRIAYVMYTSGSTGRPKGVRITHRSLCNFLAAMRERPGLGEDDILLAVTTPSFDIAGLELYLPLVVGGRVVIVPAEATRDGVELADWLARSGATFLQATPTMLQLLVDVGWKGSRSLRIACGGEPLPRALADQLLERCASLWNMYGPTETTIWSSVTPVRAEAGPPPLGGPVANTTFHVLDRHRRPVPVGVPGELYIGGAGLADGYHRRPELTAEKFVEDPVTDGGGRLYRTGDLVSWREDGRLDFHGRVDDQVKLRGFRIELGEIEALLGEYPAVAAAVAQVREDVSGDRRLVAYVMPGGDGGVEIEDLRRLLKAKLPPYMVPSAFVVLERMPTTPNGKLDRSALPAPDGARPNLERTYVPPHGPVEEVLAGIWSEVLGVDRIGVDDDFFDLGGHSLLAVRMLAEVQESFGLDLYLGTVFEHPTIRNLASVVTEWLLRDTEADELAGLLAEAEALEPLDR